ncbi:PREDICTED: uncharacterized protein LOC105627022 [Atta cephalotes]|uniref:Gustatory receptor n=1 Tax=Atta cephalotes TaxID=12957 RepID=A0A158P1N4_ATTCE|nr:PREDICTED: uncharacterized protein LOC105627022 [Atta cephalotes]
MFRIFVSLLGFQMDMLYINCVCVLKACFKEINNNLENMRELMINNIPRIYNEQRHPLLIKLKVLKKQHLIISDTCGLVNETGKNEAKKIGTTIHDIHNSISNVQIKDELNLFSLQILHCDITFSAKGLTIDATLLTVMTISDISLRLPQKSYQKLSKLIHAKDIFGFFFHFWLALTLCFSYNDKNVFGLFDVFRVFVNLLGFQIDMLYVNCVCVLKACFKEINNNLENLRELMVNNLRQIYHEQRHPFLLIKLKALKKQHLMISDTVQMLNMIFSLHLLATIALSFKQIIFYMYSNVIQWQNGKILLNQDEIDNAYFISLLIYFFTRLTLIVWACETGKNEAIKIGTIIHDVLNGINDVQIKDELNLFSLQILHCDNTFSAKGLTVDATLLTAIVNSTSTYLLILIQFLFMMHSCDSKTNAINYTKAI